MLSNFARRTAASSLVLGMLAGCTGLVSEKPVFAPADYDTSGSLLGHYTKLDGNERALVARAPEGRLAILGFEVKKAPQKDKQTTESRETITQVIYAEAAAVPLGGGDFVLQFSCSALSHEGKVYASWLGGKKSPYNRHIAYGIVAQDRKQGFLWETTNFYGSGDEKDVIFNKYDVRKGPNATKDGDQVRVIPPGISQSAAKAMFRDLIAEYMNSSGDSNDLYERSDRDPMPSAEEAAAIALNSSEACYRAQYEGDPPPN